MRFVAEFRGKMGGVGSTKDIKVQNHLRRESEVYGLKNILCTGDQHYIPYKLLLIS